MHEVTAALPAPGDAHGDAYANKWAASLHLVLGQREGQSFVARNAHRGPLRVQRAFFPEGPSVCHVYLLHPPGGVVAGDDLDIHVELRDEARCVVTTPGASKYYRSDGRRARVTQRLEVGPGAALEWLPQEGIVFDGAMVDIATRVELQEGAIFAGWDLLCLGRPSANETFNRGSCRHVVEVFLGGELLCNERIHYQGGADMLDAPWGLAGRPAVGTMFAYPASPSLLREVRALLPAPSLASAPPAPCEGELLTATLLGARADLLCCRYLGPSAARGRAEFSRIWDVVRRELLGIASVPPRIWST